METIKDFFKELKDRSSNPLISSFIISWLFCNWPITIGLLFYKFENLKADGYTSYNDMIFKNHDIGNMVLYPLIIALSYTFIFPWVRASIKLFHAKIESKNETDILEASKSGAIPIKKYIEQRDLLVKSIEQLKEIFKSEEEIKTQNISLNTENIDLQRRISTLENSLSELENRYSIMDNTASDFLLHGDWLVNIEFSNKESEEHFWNISGDIVREGRKSWIIQALTINPFERLVAFNLRSEDGGMNYSAIFLRSNENYTELRSVPGDFRYNSFRMNKVKEKTKIL